MKGAIIAIGSILLIACIFTFTTRLELIVKKVHIPAGLVFLVLGIILIIIGLQLSG